MSFSGIREIAQTDKHNEDPESNREIILRAKMQTKIDTVICSGCGIDIPENEVQKCEDCDLDGLGNCCIAPEEHVCDADWKL